MSDKRLWTIGGVLFIVAAIASLVGDNVALAGAFLAIGLLFLATPSYLEGRSRKRQ
jgi:ABC-type cobalamin transport system permease subunit